MKLLILAVCFAVAFAQDDCNCKFEGGPDGSIVENIANARLDGQKLRINELEAEVDKTVGVIGDNWARGKTFLAKNKGLLQRLDILEGNTCGYREFKCDGKCISHLLMCDGNNDCPSGADESDETCELPFTDGTAFEGQYYGKNKYGCGTTIRKSLRIIITKMTREEFLPSYIKLDFLSIVTYYKGGEELSASYNDEGYYNLALRKLVVLPKEGGDYQIALSCEFDPADNDSCHGKQRFAASWVPCNELHMFKL